MGTLFDGKGLLLCLDNSVGGRVTVTNVMRQGLRDTRFARYRGAGCACLLDVFALG